MPIRKHASRYLKEPGDNQGLLRRRARISGSAHRSIFVRIQEKGASAMSYEYYATRDYDDN